MSFFSLYIINNNGSRNIKNASEKFKVKKMSLLYFIVGKEGNKLISFNKKIVIFLNGRTCVHTHSYK